MIALLGWSLLFSAVALSKAPAPEEGPRVVIVSPLDGQQLTKVAFVIEVFGAPAGSSHAAGGAGAEPAVEAVRLTPCPLQGQTPFKAETRPRARLVPAWFAWRTALMGPA